MGFLFLCAQLCCDSIDCSLPGFPVYGILWARILEWGGIPFSKGSSRLTRGSRPHLLYLLHCRQILYLLSHWGSPISFD